MSDRRSSVRADSGNAGNPRRRPGSGRWPIQSIAPAGTLASDVQVQVYFAFGLEEIPEFLYSSGVFLRRRSSSISRSSRLTCRFSGPYSVPSSTTTPTARQGRVAVCPAGVLDRDNAVFDVSTADRSFTENGSWGHSQTPSRSRATMLQRIRLTGGFPGL